MQTSGMVLLVRRGGVSITMGGKDVCMMGL